LILCPLLIFSQELCNGNLGDNIFEDGDFGSGRDNVVQVDPNLASSFMYDLTPAPDDGFYTITNNMGVWDIQFDAWLPLSDNSSDPAGYMMVINASFEPGIFYEETIDNLCPNTTYEFSADIINVIRPGVQDHILPNVDFLLDQESKFSTGDIPQNGTWETYGFTFVTNSDQQSLVLTLRNNAPGGIGNDLALDNISFRACGPSTFVNEESRIFTCEDNTDPVILEADVDLSSFFIQWQSFDPILNEWVDIDNATGSTIFHDNFSTGTYLYRYLVATSLSSLANGKCRSNSDVITIEVVTKNFNAVDSLCSGEIYEFGTQNISTSGNYLETFISSIGCDSIVSLDFVAVEYDPIDYTIESNSPGCFDGADGEIVFSDLQGLYPPYMFEFNGELSSQNSYRDLNSDTYSVTIIDRHNCKEKINIELSDPPEFVVQLPDDITVDLGEEVFISAMANQVPLSYNWITDLVLDCMDCLDVNMIPSQSGTLLFEAVNNEGCSDIDSMKITVLESEIDIYIPNIFSPNNDGYNDTFIIGARKNLVQSIDNITIYDRWGNPIFIKNNIDINDKNGHWDGTANNQNLDTGVYTYSIEMTYLNGETDLRIGTISIIR